METHTVGASMANTAEFDTTIATLRTTTAGSSYTSATTATLQPSAA